MQPGYQRQFRVCARGAHSLYRPPDATYVWSGLKWSRPPAL